MLQEVALVVDQEVIIRKLISRILSRQGFTVLTAANGAAAAYVCREGKEPIALAVVDLLLREPDARETIRIVRELYPEAAIVITSGQPGIDGAAVAADLDADMFLAKPFRSVQLTQAVIDAFAGRGARAGK